MMSILFSPNVQDRLMVGLRISLGVVFVWFGTLKVAGFNPVYEIIAAGFPFFASGIGFTVLGLLETVIGIGLILNLFPVVTHIALLLHLAGTFSVFALGPELMFNPYFPILTLEGEFVFKNAVLAMSGFVTLTYHTTRFSAAETK